MLVSVKGAIVCTNSDHFHYQTTTLLTAM